MALSCFVNDMDTRNLAEKDELEVGEDRIKTVDFLLAGLPYNVRRYEKDDHAEYNVLGTNDIKDMVKIRENVMRPGAHGHSFAPLYNLPPDTRLLLLQKWRNEPVPGYMLESSGFRARKVRV